MKKTIYIALLSVVLTGLFLQVNTVKYSIDENISLQEITNESNKELDDLETDFAPDKSQVSIEDYANKRNELAELVSEENWQTEQTSEGMEYFLPNELMVMVEPEANLDMFRKSISELLPDVTIAVISSEFNILQLTTKNPIDKQIAEQLQGIESVLSIERNYMVSLKKIPNTVERYAVGLSNPQESTLQKPAKDSNHYPVKVCFVDTGVQIEHDAFKGLNFTGIAVKNGVVHVDFSDDHGHGTSMVDIVASTMTAATGSNSAIDICMAKVFNSSGFAKLSDIIIGTLWIKNQDPDIVNFSLGIGVNSRILERITAVLHQTDALLVAAAGNSGFNGALYPASYKNVLSIGSHDKTLGKSKFSNWGEEVTAFAPGDFILAATYHPELNNTYNTFSGTSISSAVVSGYLGYLISDSGSTKNALEKFNSSIYPVQSDEYREPINVVDTSEVFNLSSPSYVVTKKSKSSRLPRTDSPLALRYTVKNLSQKSDLGNFKLVATMDGERSIIDSKSVKENNKEIHLEFDVLPVEIERTKSNGSLVDQSVSFYLELNDTPIYGSGQRVVFTNDQVKSGDVVDFSVSPLNVFDNKVSKKIRINYANMGNEVLSDLVFSIYAIDAIHEGLPDGDRSFLGSFKTNKTLKPEDITTLEFNLGEFEFPARHVTFEVNANAGSEVVSSYLQELSYGSYNGEAIPLYNQARHRELIPKAVELLRKQGIYIPDLHQNNSPYLGNVSTFYNWPKIGLPTSQISTTGYYDDAFKAATQKKHAGFDYNLIAGVHDSDGVDIVFNYSFEDNFDTHFWMDDSFDDDGLDSSGKNHHSALTKMQILLNGPSNSPHGSDSVLQYGAIEHYKAGHKAGAWYLLGHALHSLQDLSNPSHVDSNEHGVYGATYHNWIDRTGHQYWNAESALARGGFIDPYQAAALGEPLRFLAYSTQQISGAFPWNSVKTGYWGRDGNRNLGGQGNTYPTYMHPLMNSLASHPSKQWHVSKDEIYDSKWWVKKCELVDWVGVGEKRRDCWDGNGHIDYDNTDNDGSNADGDLYAIGESNYVHAIQATAGLIYYFAKETGQL